MQRLLPSSLVLMTLGLASAAEKTDLVAVPNEPAMKVPKGVQVRVAADDKGQGLISPTALTFDESGALYVAETHRFSEGVEDDRGHLYWYLDDLAARTTDDRRALHEKWKEKVPLEKLTRKSESIRRLVDRDGDGRFEDSGIFADGFNDLLDGTGTGLLALDGTVYYACIPKIWALRDPNQDGKADEKNVIQDGFGVHVSFSGHDLNGFALGPDGRIYGSIGDRGLNLTTREGKKLELTNQGCVIRFEPDGGGLEIIHTGLRNPKEVAFDQAGNLFTIDNNSDQGDKARLVYIAEGADSGWEMEHQTLASFHQQIGLAEYPPNRWMAERMWEPANPDQPAYLLPPVANVTSGPAGLAYHPGAGFLQKEAGRFVVCDYRGSAPGSGLWSFKVEPKGAGMKLVDPRKLAWGVTATDVEYSWDGRLFVTDFRGGWITHQEGRVISLDAGKATWRAEQAAEVSRLVREGFDQRPAAELATLLKHADMRVRLRAQLALTRKSEGLELFKTATASADPLERLHGIWGLGVIARRGSAMRPPGATDFPALPDVGKQADATKLLLPLLKHADAEVRAQTIKVLGDAGRMNKELQLGALIGDSSPRVRFFATIAAGKLHAAGETSAVWDMLSANGGKDPYLFHAGVFALQRLSKPLQLQALTLAPSAHVRLAAVVALRRMGSDIVSEFLHDEDPRVANEAIRAIHDGSIEPVRPLVAALLDDESSLSARKPFMLRRLIHSAFRVGGTENAQRLVRVTNSPKVPVEVRREALRLLSLWPEPPVADQSTGHLMNLSKRDPQEVLPLIRESMPKWLKLQGELLTGVMQVVERYELPAEVVSDQALRTLIDSPAAPGKARAMALSMLAKRQPADLSAVLSKQAQVKDAALSLVALELLVERFPKEAIKPLLKAAESPHASVSQSAWKSLGALKEEAVAPVLVRQLESLRTKRGVSPVAVEVLEAARGRSEPEVKAAVEAYNAAVKASTDPLATAFPSLEGGDPKKGAEVFQSHSQAECRRCHRAEVGGDSGGEIGPNLASVGNRGDRRYLLESLVNPSAKVAPGFGIVSLTLKNDATLGGVLLKESPDFVDIDAAGKAWRIKRADIKTLTPAVSAMPPMGAILTPTELRDVVAWLAAQKQKVPAPTQASTPPVLDPKTLATP
jgi:quinoprotein glucose dehydrogenase